MTLDVHGLMQNAHNINFLRRRWVKEEMRAGRKFLVTGAHLVTRLAKARIIGDGFDRRLNFAKLDLGLVGVPELDCIVAKFPRYRPEPSGREGKTLHGCGAPSARLRAMNASKSKGVDAPLVSPSTRAARSAASFVSCSSKRRRAARTTSLAEP